MGKSTKKSVTKVDATAVGAAPPKLIKTSKRDAEDALAEKELVTVSSKKRRVKKKKVKVVKAEKVGEEEVETLPGSQDAPANGTMDLGDPQIDISEEDDSATKKIAASEEGTENVSEKRSMESTKEDKEESPEADGGPQKSTKSNEADVEITDIAGAKANGNDKATDEAPENPDTPNEQSEGQRTLFVGNLSFSIERSDIENFFKVAGEVTDVRFGMYPDNTFRGFGHVEFATAEQAEKALLELNGTELLGRRVRLDLARERATHTHSEGNDETQSQQKGAGGQGRTVFIRGFDKKSSEDQVRSLLEKNFGSCGEISRISIPKDDEGLKGIAYIEFNDGDAFNKAVESNGFDFGEGPLSVEEAKPRRGGPGGGRRGGRFGSGGGRFRGGRRGRF